MLLCQNLYNHISVQDSDIMIVVMNGWIYYFCFLEINYSFASCSNAKGLNYWQAPVKVCCWKMLHILIHTREQMSRVWTRVWTRVWEFAKNYDVFHLPPTVIMLAQQTYISKHKVREHFQVCLICPGSCSQYLTSLILWSISVGENSALKDILYPCHCWYTWRNFAPRACPGSMTWVQNPSVRTSRQLFYPSKISCAITYLMIMVR